MMKNSLHTELMLWKDAETFTVTRQVDHDIADKIDRKAFREAALSIWLPTIFTDQDFMFITLICQASDKGKNEIWEHEVGVYMTLILPYQFVVSNPPQVVLREFLLLYQSLIDNVTDIPDLSEDFI